jgi:hypothetical protein
MCLLAAVAACGRWNFDRVPSDAASPDSAPDACVLGGWQPSLISTPFEQLNTSGATEWAAEISGDGLRMVFVREDGPGAGVYITQRRSRSEAFEAPTALGVVGGPSLSEDGRELYATDDICINQFTRTGPRLEDWSAPHKLDALCSGGRPSGVYLSRNGLRLYYNVAGVLTVASRLSVSAEFVDPGVKVKGPSGLDFCALSGDELAMYCEDLGQGGALAQSTRLSLADPFQPEVVIQELKDDHGYSDPSVTADGTLLVFSANDNAGGKFDIYAVERRCE